MKNLNTPDELFHDLVKIVNSLGFAISKDQGDISDQYMFKNNLSPDMSVNDFLQHREEATSVADTFVSNFLISYLSEYSDVAVISEEQGCKNVSNEAKFVLFLDPVNGSLEYLRGGKGFEINLYLTNSGMPAFGMSLKPRLSVFRWFNEGRTNLEPWKHGSENTNKVRCNEIAFIEYKELLFEHGYEVVLSINDNDAAIAVNDCYCDAFIGREMKSWDFFVTAQMLRINGGILLDEERRDIWGGKVDISFVVCSREIETAHKLIDILC